MILLGVYQELTKNSLRTMLGLYWNFVFDSPVFERAILGLFLFIFVFSIQLNIFFANDWIQTADLWHWR